MSLLKRIIGAFKPYDDSAVPEADAFGVTQTGQGRLAVLGEGLGVVIGCATGDEEVLELTVAERPSAQNVAVDGVSPERLRGLLLDWDPMRNSWRLLLPFTLHGSETPNPQGRLYKASRRVASGPPSFFTRSTVNPLLVQWLLEHEGIGTVLLRGHTLTVGRVGEDVEWQVLDTHVDQVLRNYFLGAGRIVSSGERTQYASALEQAVAEVIEERILPAVHRDGGDLQLVEIRDGVVRVNMTGACRNCPSSTVTLHRGVEAVLKRAFPDRVRG
ncbi:MAG: NifU family protein, partial [Myxococcota bacterium]